MTKGDGGLRSEVRGQRSVGRRSGAGGQRTEDRSRRSKDRGQGPEVRGRRAEVRGQRSEITTEETLFEPTNPYGESKLAAERVFLNWAKERSDRNLIIIRPTVVFGPHN